MQQWIQAAFAEQRLLDDTFSSINCFLEELMRGKKGCATSTYFSGSWRSRAGMVTQYGSFFFTGQSVDQAQG